MQNHRSPTRVKPSQVSSLPPLVAPWQQEETTPNRPHYKSQTSPCQEDPPAVKTTSSSAPINHLPPELERGGNSTKRFEDLESRLASLEQTKLLANIAGSPNESGELRNELVRLSTELSSHVKQLEQRTLQNEQRLLKEEVAMATLAQLMQETERKVVEIQRQLDAERREQKECRAALGERLQQLEHRQAQLAEFGRKTNEALSTGVKRMGKELRALSTRVETLGGSVVGQMSGFYHRQSVLEERLQTVQGVTVGMQRNATELKKYTDSRLLEVRTGLREIEDRLTQVGRAREKQDTQLRESFLGVRTELETNSAHLRELFQAEMRESCTAMAEQNRQLHDGVLSAMEYGRRDCLRERESLRKELETRLTATEEALEAEKKKNTAQLKDLRSSIETDSTRIRSELTKQIRSALEQGEQGRKMLQGAVSVVEQEARVTRQEIVSVMEAEIKTRYKEVSELREEVQRLSGELEKHTHSVRNSLEALDQTMAADREQVQMVQESLLGQWHEVGVHLPGNTNPQLPGVQTNTTNVSVKRNHQQQSTSSPPSHNFYLNSGELSPRAQRTLRTTPNSLKPLDTPLSQASYLIEDDDDDRGGEGEKQDDTATKSPHDSVRKDDVRETKISFSQPQEHQLWNARKYSGNVGSGRNPLHSKSRIVLSPPEVPEAEDTHVTGERELVRPAEQSERVLTWPDECESNEGGDLHGEACDTPATLDKTKHTVVEISRASTGDRFGKSGGELDSSAILSSEHSAKASPTITDQQVGSSPTEPTSAYDQDLEGAAELDSGGSITDRKSQEEREQWGNREDSEELPEAGREATEGVDGDRQEIENGNGQEEKVVWTIGDPNMTD